MTRHDDDEPFDERGILKDGGSVRLPMMMRDSMPKPEKARSAGRPPTTR